MTLTSIIQTTSALGAIVMIVIGSSWIKQLARDAMKYASCRL